MSECQHGQLARSCDLCEKDKRIAELEAELAATQKELTYSRMAATAEARRVDELGKEKVAAQASIVQLLDALRRAYYACLDAALTEAKREGMLEAARVCDTANKWMHPSDLANAIRQAAERKE